LSNKIIDDDDDEIGTELEAKEVRINVIGNVDSGKSTLVGVLSRCKLDDGRGLARGHVFTFKHEVNTGRTTSITQEIMGFKNGKQIEPGRANERRNNSWKEIIREADKVITLCDLCGHEKYLKTTIFGMTGLVPDYAMVVVGANMGLQKMTKEHIGIALALRIPIFVVITKIDIAPDDVYQKTLNQIIDLFNAEGIKKKTLVVKENENVDFYSENMKTEVICPIFNVSSVSGTGFDQLRAFIAGLTSRAHLMNTFKSENDKVEFRTDGSFMVKGIGLVVSGVLVAGRVSRDMQLKIGPDKKGDFKVITVKSIHFKRSPVDEITAGNSCCFQIKSKENIKQKDIRKGMVMLEKDDPAKVCYEFDADVSILNNHTTIKIGYQAVVHIGTVRQTAQVVKMNKPLLRLKDTDTIRFKFVSSPEYIHVGESFLFREGRTRGVGQVKQLFYK
jgi:GTPase